MKRIYLGMIEEGYFLNLRGVRDAHNSATIICNDRNGVLDILPKHRKLELIYDRDVSEEDIEFIRINAEKKRIKLESVVLDERYI